MKYLLAALIGGTLAVVAYIELSARRGVPAPLTPAQPGWLAGQDKDWLPIEPPRSWGSDQAWRDYERVDAV